MSQQLQRSPTNLRLNLKASLETGHDIVVTLYLQ